MCLCVSPGRLSPIGVLYSSSHACCGKDHGDDEDCDGEEWRNGEESEDCDGEEWRSGLPFFADGHDDADEENGCPTSHQDCEEGDPDKR